MAANDVSLDAYMYFVGDGARKLMSGSEKSIGPIEGETLDAGYAKLKAFQINSFDWSIKADTSSSGLDATPHVTAKVEAFKITKEPDLATPSLFFAAATRAQFKIVHVFFRKAAGGTKSAGGNKQLFFKYLRFKFNKVVVDSWKIDMKNKAEVEEVTFAFDWCEVKYVPQATHGNKGKAANIKHFSTAKPDETTPPPDFLKKEQDVDVDLSEVDWLK